MSYSGAGFGLLLPWTVLPILLPHVEEMTLADARALGLRSPAKADLFRNVFRMRRAT